ncbi:hypothetical protein ABZV61_24780 [Streptomyces sp900116325]|uniref:Uncharacterized protein n=1 Tax=Streptomyces sp. 900116325 TaxID=3154295 RepID=A0ABV2UDN0_9ACTN
MQLRGDHGYPVLVRVRGCAGGADGSVSDGRHPQVDRCRAPGDEVVELGEFLLCSGKADLEALDLTAPAFALRFGDAGDQVVADVDQPSLLGRGRSKE